MKNMTGTLRHLLAISALAALIFGCQSTEPDYSQSASSEPNDPGKTTSQPESSHDGWLTDLDKAMAEAKSSNKMVLVDFTASWCGPCQMYIKNIFPTDAFKQAAKDYILVSIDIDAQASLASKYEVNSVPDIRIFSPKGDQVEHLIGYYGEKLIEKMKSAQQRAGL